jgi:hypothetical protein
MIGSRRARLLGVGALALAGLLFGSVPGQAQVAAAAAASECDLPRDVSASSPRIYEGSGGGTVSFTFVITTSGCDHAATVSYATAAGTAFPPADYTATSGSLVWTHGDMSTRTVTVQVARDSVDEPNETFTLVIGAVAGSLTTSSGTATILDDDGPLSWNIDDTSCGEGDAPTKQCAYRITVSQPQAVSRTVRVSTQGQSAVSGSDYQGFTNRVLTLPPGAVTVTDNFTILGDDNCEGNETLKLVLNTPSIGDLTDDTAIATIESDEIFC